MSNGTRVIEMSTMNGSVKDNVSNLRFNGSVWCNLDIALRNIDQIFNRVVQPLGLSVIEWYILRALYNQNGQHASELARSVGRAATSFTPNLDKLQDKGLIKRKPDPTDRRAVRIYLTNKAEAKREEIMGAAKMLDKQLSSLFNEEDYRKFQGVLAMLQVINLD